MKEVLISIIVPVYNVEKYLHRCVSSVLEQTYAHWELLLVDDGSTDASGRMCDEYTSVDSRIRVIHKKNTGVSDTKNKALDIAQGDYIIFLDADDYWTDECAIEHLLTVALQYDVDIVRGEYKAVDSAGCDLFVREIDDKKQRCANKVVAPSVFLDEVIQREFFLCVCLVKATAISAIRFNTKKVFLEDVEFFIYLLLKPVKCMYVPFRFYAYRKHEKSASNNYSPKRLADAFDMSRLYLQLSDLSIDKRMENSFVVRAIDYYRLTLQTIAVNEAYDADKKQLCEELRIGDLNKAVFRYSFLKLKSIRWECYLSPAYLIRYYKIRSFLGRTYRHIFNQ